MLAEGSNPTSLRPEMRIMLSLASIWRSTLSTPGSSMIATKSSPCWKILIGGKAPVPAVLLPNQSLSCRASSARCNAKIASNGLLKLVGMCLLLDAAPARRALLDRSFRQPALLSSAPPAPNHRANDEQKLPGGAFFAAARRGYCHR